MKTFYLVYKITNNIDGKHYIGVHKTNDINDSYMGSGKVLRYAIKKYGIENFTKEVLAVFDAPEDMYQMESVLVDAEFVKRDDTYNIKLGGHGGWDHINSLTKEELKSRMQKLNMYPNKRFTGHKHTKETLDKIQERRKKNPITPETRKKISDGNRGRVMSEHHRQKISESNKIAQSGIKNSQFGTMWINDKESNKKIKKDDEIPTGWVKGRIYPV